jgi:small multidrug resistance family-3 protein
MNLHAALSIGIFLLAGLCEIGGGYLVWLTLREQKPPCVALLGGLALIAYGVIPTLQPAPFGRVYAAYGGVFIGLSLLWGALIDHTRPDLPDLIGAALALIGAGTIMYWPRG